MLVGTGDGRKDAATGRASGRARDGRLVHLALRPADGAGQEVRPAEVRPGDLVTTTVTRAAPHHLVADAGIRAHRRPGGDIRDAAAPAGAGQLLTIGSRPPET